MLNEVTSIMANNMKRVLSILIIALFLINVLGDFSIAKSNIHDSFLNNHEENVIDEKDEPITEEGDQIDEKEEQEEEQNEENDLEDENEVSDSDVIIIEDLEQFPETDNITAQSFQLAQWNYISLPLPVISFIQSLLNK